MMVGTAPPVCRIYIGNENGVQRFKIAYLYANDMWQSYDVDQLTNIVVLSYHVMLPCECIHFSSVVM